MSNQPVRAISFDLWDTVFIDDSDEPKRKSLGLPDKKTARRELVQAVLQDRAPVSREQINLAYDVVDAAFRKVWHDQHVTWSVTERLQVLLDGLGQSLPQPEFTQLVRQHEEMELEHRPDLVPGVAETLKTLAMDHTLVVISDAIFSPGWALRKLLEAYGLLSAFSGFVFSDEIGCSKPAPEMFHRAAELAGCDLEALVHIGDREHNDVAGPQSLGARAIMCTCALDRDSRHTRADAVCRDYADLPDIIATLNRST